MPYPIWCTTCPKPTIIGQGVRFNAEKKKVGNYYSTPIFSFRMKHVACDGWIEIRTDPKNTAYVVTEGAKKRDTGDDKVHERELGIRTDKERQKLQNDAFAALEVTIDDRKQAVMDKTRIEELLEAKDKDWDDPYAVSRRLRQAFRADRKIRQKREALTENLKDRMSLGMDLLDETEEDRRRAGFVEFGSIGDAGSERAILHAQAKPLFKAGTGNIISSRRKRKQRLPIAEQEAERTKERLKQELKDNTRAALDPFLTDQADRTVPFPLLSSKRKKSSVLHGTLENRDTATTTSRDKAPLVDYDSD